MRDYMPGPHKKFLQRVSETANIRQYVTAHLHDTALKSAYNQCLEGLISFRNKHVQIVSRYLVVPLRTSSVEKKETDGQVSSIRDDILPEALISKDIPLGTGGTSPVEFLKQVRNETREGLL